MSRPFQYYTLRVHHFELCFTDSSISHWGKKKKKSVISISFLHRFFFPPAAIHSPLSVIVHQASVSDLSYHYKFARELLQYFLHKLSNVFVISVSCFLEVVETVAEAGFSRLQVSDLFQQLFLQIHFKSQHDSLETFCSLTNYIRNASRGFRPPGFHLLHADRRDFFFFFMNKTRIHIKSIC